MDSQEVRDMLEAFEADEEFEDTSNPPPPQQDLVSVMILQIYIIFMKASFPFHYRKVYTF